MSRFFISHSSNDAVVAHQVCKALTEAGHTCWIAPESIKYGDPWPESITKGLVEGNGGVFLLLLSKSANDSKHVKREVGVADSLNVKMLVFRIGDFSLDYALRFFFTLEQMYQCDADPEKHSEEIIRELLSEDWRKRTFSGTRSAAILKEVEPPADYIPREQENDITETLRSGKICTLFGEIGMGKSSLAKSWYRKHKSEYKDILFIHAETLVDVMKCLCLRESELNGDPASIIKSAVRSFIFNVLSNDGEKILLLIDNLGYDRGASFEKFEELMCGIINKLGEDRRADIIVTTRLNHVFYSNTRMIYVGDFSEDEALEYLKKDFSAPFNEEAARSLVRNHGIVDVKTGLVMIPAITCDAIKNTAKHFSGYENVVRLIGTKRGLPELVSGMLDSFRRGSEREKLFAVILEIASFQDGDALTAGLLRDITVSLTGCNSEQFFDCLAFFDLRLTLLNITDKSGALGEQSRLTMHRNYQQVINKLVVGNRTEIKKAIVEVFLTRIRPFSYYGTQTLADPEAVMEHMLAFYEIVKNERNDPKFYSLIRAAAWYYGYVCRDREIYDELSSGVIDFDNASAFDKLMGKIDREIINTVQRETGNVEFALDALALEADRMFKRNPGIEAFLIMIRYRTALAYYQTFYGELKTALKVLEKGEKDCEEIKAGYLKMEVSEEQLVFAIESLAQMYCLFAREERIRGGRNKWDNVERYCQKGIDCLSGSEYLHCLERLKMERASSFLLAQVINLQGVSLNERKPDNLEDQYKAEEKNTMALDEYLSVQYLSGIANQQLNYVNIYRAQARAIINAINKYIRTRGEPASPEEWRIRYESEDIVPDLTDRDGYHKSVKAWIEEYRAAIFQAKQQRRYSRITRSRYHAPASECYYSYMVPLASCERCYNAYTTQEKYNLILTLFDDPEDPDSREGLENALRIPGLSDVTVFQILFYQATLERYLMECCDDAEEIHGRYLKACDCLARAIDIGKRTGNTDSVHKAKTELNRVRAIYKIHKR